MNSGDDADLSASDARVNAQEEGGFNTASLLYRQRYEQRRGLFLAVLVACGLMLLSFLLFVGSVVLWVWLHPNQTLDWHLLLLGSALVVPPTLVSWALMKHVFRADGRAEPRHQREDDEIPLVEFVRSVVERLPRNNG